MSLSSVIVDGNTAQVANAAADAQGGGGIFNNGGSVAIQGASAIINNVVTGANQTADDGGGGIFNDGRNTPSASVTVSGSTVISGNTALDNFSNGGGVLNLGVLPVGDTLFSAGPGVEISNNQAFRAGGGIESTNADLLLDGVLIDGNSTGINGGGVHATGGDVVSISNSTVSNNIAGQEGGGIWNSSTGTMSLSSVIVDGNTAQVANAAADAQGGGGIFNNGGLVNLSGASQVINNAVDGPAGTDDGGGGIFNDGRNTGSAELNLSGTSLVSGNSAVTGTGGGGGILNAGAEASGAVVTASAGVQITGNQAAASGGGVFNLGGTVTISDVTLDNNTSTDGGGMAQQSGTAELRRSTVSNNSSVGAARGGGLFLGAGELTFLNGTISGNGSEGDGGGVYVSGGQLRAINATIIANQAGEGGGLKVSGGTAEIGNTVLAHNSAASGPDVSGSFTGLGYNLIFDTSGAVLGGSLVGNITGESALLGPLADNGGVTLTHHPMDLSPVVDNGGGGLAAAESITTDQRGQSRLVDLPDFPNADDGIDMGSVETQFGTIVGGGDGSGVLVPVPTLGWRGLLALMIAAVMGGRFYVRRGACR
jgi:hypothetical protein